MTKNKIDVHRLGRFFLPACVLVISVGFGLIISVYGQVSASSVNKLASCVDNISVACKNLGYDEKCTNSSIFSQFTQLKSLITGETADTTCTGDSCSANDAISQKLSQCEAILEQAKKMDKASTTSSEKTDTATDPSGSTDNSQPVSSDDYGYMSNQIFSATSITSAASDSKCKGTKKGQIILVSNIKAGSGSIQSAFYNSLDWTKRGKVFDISSEIKSSIIDKLKKENKLESVFGTTDEKVIEANLISGSVFYDVPLGQNFSGLVYSSSWSGKSLAISSFEGPKSECESAFVAVNYTAAAESLTDQYKVCVHSKDKSKDYKEKKTFIYPEDKTDAEAYKLADKDRIISLGPCQTDETSGGTSGSSSGSGGSGQNVGESNVGIGAADVSSGASSNQLNSLSISQSAQIALKRLNEFRKEQGKSEFVFDSSLQSFADFRAQYFSTLTYDYVHSQGGHPLFGEHSTQKQIISIEEVSTAQGTDDWTFIAQGLIDSDEHRQGLLESSGKIGITATTLQDGNVLVVELSK